MKSFPFMLHNKGSACSDRYFKASTSAYVAALCQHSSADHILNTYLRSILAKVLAKEL